MNTKKILTFGLFSIFAPTASWAMEDEIIFFNVGQGHCTLVRRMGYVPLLIDAGSKQNVERVEDGKKPKRNKYKELEGKKVAEDVVKKINEYWNDNQSISGKLNIVVTHGDEDHVKYIPNILEKLKQGRQQINFNLLLGGLREHYQTKKKNYYQELSQYTAFYSSEIKGLSVNGGFVSWGKDSGCITHLYCPAGYRGRSEDDKNTWSIVTRVEVNQQGKPLSAMITGDAEDSIQVKMLQTLDQTQWHKLESDILLYPHHGAKPLNPLWACLINPQAVVISAGNFGGGDGGYRHPRKEALTSLLSTLHSQYTHLMGQMSMANLTTTLPIYSARLWQQVQSHRIVYYEEQNQPSVDLGAALPNIQHQIPTINPLLPPITITSKYEFSSKPWYISLEKGWQCTQLTLPIYTTYTSGTLVFKRKLSGAYPFDVDFIDCPTDIELMAQVIQGDLGGERKAIYPINGVLDDGFGDYQDFLSLSPETIQKSFLALQAFQGLRANLHPGEAIKYAKNHARKILFLSFITIPHKETNNQKKELQDFREANLVPLLDYFRTITQHINFADIRESSFFNNVTDLLFGDVWHYKNFKTVKKLKDRGAIFNSFILSPHYNTSQRHDWLYLYCLIYKALPNHRHLLAQNQLPIYVEKFKTIPFYNSLGVYPVGGLEDRIIQAHDIYYYCSDPMGYRMNFYDIPDLIQELSMLNLGEMGVRLSRDLLSWFPPSFTSPAHLTIKKIAPFITQLDRLGKKEFKKIGQKLAESLPRYPSTTSHADILEAVLKKELQYSY